MIQKLCGLVRKHWDILVYLFFGVLTTLVNYLVYYPLLNFLNWPAGVCNVIAWAVSVLFAYLTNKPFVFRSHCWRPSTVIPESVKFVGSRLLSGGIESISIFLLVDILRLDGNIWKLIISVVVVIINYIASKYLVFTKKK